MPTKDRTQRKRKAELEKCATKCKKMSTLLSKVGPSENGKEDIITDRLTNCVQPKELHATTDANSQADNFCPSMRDSSSPMPSTPKSKKTSQHFAHPLVKVQTVESWRVNDKLTWISYKKAEDGFHVSNIWCKVCREVYGNKAEQLTGAGHAGQAKLVDDQLLAYIQGTTNVKKDTVKSHHSNRTHNKALIILKEKNSENLLKKQLLSMSEAAQNRMYKLFDWAYFIAKKEESFRSFKDHIEMESKHRSDMGSKYHNDKACRMFVDAIGSVMRKDLTSLFQKQPFYCSLLFDGSTDKALSEKEVISVKFVENGEPKIQLLGISHPKSQKAEDIYEAIIEKSDAMNLPLVDVCIGAGADGASVNFGRKSGVMVRLETNMPWLVKIHCVAHRLELALKDAFKETYFETVIHDFLLKLYYMFERAPKKFKNFQLLADILEENVVKVTKAQGTRWINHRLIALKALDRDYKTLRMLFREMGSGPNEDITVVVSNEMKRRLKDFKTYEFALHLSSYIDLCKELSVLSKSFQAENLPITAVRAYVEVASMSLIAMVETPGSHLSKFEQDIVLEDEQGDVKWLFRDVELTEKTERKRESFQACLSEVVNKVSECLDSRFLEFSDNSLFLAFDIFDPSNIPSAENKEAIISYGNKELKVVVDHFAPIMRKQGCDVFAIEREWLKLKLDVKRNHAGQEFIDLWGQIIREKSGKYPNIIHILHIILACPVATSHIERQFSAVKRILGDWRLRMGLETCEHLLPLSLKAHHP